MHEPRLAQQRLAAIEQDCISRAALRSARKERVFFCLFVCLGPALSCTAEGERERLDFAVLSFQGG